MDELQTEKLDRFVNSVNNEVDEKINKIISEVESQKKVQIQKTEDEALLNAYNKIQKSIREIESKYRRMLALKHQQFKSDFLRQRESLVESIFESVKKQVCLFTDSEKYQDYLTSLVKSEDVHENSVIMISEKDMKYREILSSMFKCQVEADPEIEIGGITIVDNDNGIVIDRTLDSAFEEQRKNFSSRYKFRNENLN